MKRIVFLFFYLFTFLPLTIDAAPAWPFPFQVKQPDGTMLTILLHGDEHFHWVTTADDGVLLVSKDNGYYVADIDASGKLTATTLLAHDPIKRTTTELTAIERQAPRRALFIEQGTARMEQARRAQSISTAGGYFPHIAKPRVLIILAAYTDKDFTVENPKETFDDYFNGDRDISYVANSRQNICSVAKYFDTVSDGKYKPQFDVVGPVTLPKDMSYYGYGGGNPNNEKLKQLCEDACNLVKDSVDFKDYDNDGNNNAELIYIVHAGYGENTGGPAETMWAKCGTINITVNNTTIVRGGCHSELFSGTNINGIGPFIHEFSHGMGLPDIYSTTASAQKAINQNMQSWDVMDYGIYNNSGYAPAAYTAWEQETFGWITLQQLMEPATGISTLPLLAGGTAYKIQNPKKLNEYIILENIQKRSLNSAARGHGLLAYHIDYASNIVNMGDKINNNIGYPRIAVIPSGGLQFSTYCIDDVTYTDSLWLATHKATPFPGTSKVATLTDEQELPNYCFYAGETKTPVGHSLYDITETNGIVTFSFDQYASEPIEEESEIVISNIITEETNLKNTIVDNVYYNLNGENDGYDATEECLIINTTTDISEITIGLPGSTDVKNNFTGLILEVNGTGTLTIDCQTLGTSVLNVKIGDNEPTVIQQDERNAAEVTYDVTGPTYVYIYATSEDSSAPLRAAASENAVKIYSLAVTSGTTGFTPLTTHHSPLTDTYYTLDGYRLNGKPTRSGVYIYNGRKVMIQ